MKTAYVLLIFAVAGIAIYFLLFRKGSSSPVSAKTGQSFQTSYSFLTGIVNPETLTGTQQSPSAFNQSQNQVNSYVSGMSSVPVNYPAYVQPQSSPPPPPPSSSSSSSTTTSTAPFAPVHGVFAV